MHRLEFLILLATQPPFVNFALKFRGRCFPRQLFSGILLSMLQTGGKKRMIDEPNRRITEYKTASLCSPCGCVGTGDLKSDLFNGSGHYFIVGLD